MAKDVAKAGDPVNPSHYKQGAVECIEGIKAALGQEGFEDFLRGQVIKYIWRGRLKADFLEDCRKAQWYLNRLVKELEGR